jgi:hypothetical protein
MVRPEDWRDFGPSDPEKGLFQNELAREVRKGHELFGLDLAVVSRRLAQDDVLVTTPGRTGCAAVHLTWARGRETPPWPRTTWFDSVEDAKEALDDS